MATQTDPRAKPRVPLSRERVLHAAIGLADTGGIESLTMRKLGEEVGVEAMSLYNHVANKEDILDGIVDLVFGEIALPSAGADWKPAMRRRAISAHQALLRHTWAPSLMQSRTKPGPATLRRRRLCPARWPCTPRRSGRSHPSGRAAHRRGPGSTTTVDRWPERRGSSCRARPRPSC